MKLIETCIKQPVLAIVLNLLLIVIGLVGYTRLELRYFPKLNTPLVNIKTEYAGAGSKLIENSITTPIENALSGVPGVASISSYSSNSWSSITIRFRLGGDFEQEVSDVRDKVSAARKNIPVAADPSIITVGGVERAALSIGFTDPKKSSEDIRDYVGRYVKPILRDVPGVGAISIYGASDYALRIWLDAQKMAILGVTVSDVEVALQSNNIQFPSGQIKEPNRNYTIISDTKLTTPKQFANIIIKKSNGSFIRFKDIAKVELGSRSLQESPMRINGKPAVDLEVKPLKGANPIEVSAAVRKALAQLKPNLPRGMSATVNYDQSEFLKASIRESFVTIAEAIGLVVIVVFLFLGSIRASMIPIITIPLCVIAVFGLMYLLDFSINIMTLLAVVLSIGLVVDDAIVMLENIHRYIEEGMSSWKAAMKGSKEIAGSVIAMTLTLAAVYAPIGFAQGYTAILFKEFAFTLAGAVIISGFVALTLSPMMCSRILSPQDSRVAFVHWLDAKFDLLAVRYKNFLRKALSKRMLIVLGLLVIGFVGYLLFIFMPSEFVPQEDTGLIVTSVRSPTGSSVNYTDRFMRQIEKIYAKIPAIKAYYSMISSGSATSYLALKPWDERDITTQQLVAKLAPLLAQIPGVDAFPSIPDPIDYGAGGSDVTLQVMTPASYKVLQKPMANLVAAVKKYPGLQNVKSNIKFDDQQYAIHINRDLAADLGVNIQDIATTLSAMMGGAHVTDLDVDGQSFRVIVQMRKKDLENFNGIKTLYVRNLNNQMIPLSSLIKLKPIIGQSTLRHFNRMRAAALTAQLAPGYSISDAVDFLQKVVPKYMTPKTRYAFDGKAAQFIDSSGNAASIFALALVFIYLILAAQFGSFIDPFIILFSVPLSIVGALFTLWLFGGSLNLYSQIGLVTLVGMISKHGILITQFTNQLREQGKGLLDALVEASAIRLRPILMTTSAMVIGTIPLALATGPGSVGRQQIGWVIVGGLLFGTFFSLIVVPVAYAILAKFKR